ncbi:Uncharacterised protein [Legionella busanensis]|uniref:Uncharacterized protein n=1 Tax=Legionella busanensis TaxID=190655 RepID=A0A378JR39_9GAMM|nr:hypothetical protein [Legionella busanensis]STX52649.1 Uncharacterised protein [Legionella busanensis]
MTEGENKKEVSKDISNPLKKNDKSNKSNQPDSPNLKLRKLTIDPLRPMEGATELAEKIKNELALEATTNDLTQKKFFGIDEDNPLCNNVPDYQITDVEHSIDEDSNQSDAKIK